MWTSLGMLQTLLLCHPWVNLSFPFPNLYAWHKAQVILWSSIALIINMQPLTWPRLLL